MQPHLRRLRPPAPRTPDRPHREFRRSERGPAVRRTESRGAPAPGRRGNRFMRIWLHQAVLMSPRGAPRPSGERPLDLRPSRIFSAGRVICSPARVARPHSRGLPGPTRRPAGDAHAVERRGRVPAPVPATAGAADFPVPAHTSGTRRDRAGAPLGRTAARFAMPASLIYHHLVLMDRARAGARFENPPSERKSLRMAVARRTVSNIVSNPADRPSDPFPQPVRSPRWIGAR